MSLFKYRLKQVGKTLLTYIITIGFVVMLMWGATYIPQLVVYWFGGIFIGIFVLLGLWAFIYWLFVEPFKKDK